MAPPSGIRFALAPSDFVQADGAVRSGQEGGPLKPVGQERW